MRLTICLFFIAASLISSAQVAIIPAPQSVQRPGESSRFMINRATKIVKEGSGMEKAVSFLSNYLSKYYSLRLSVTEKTTTNNVIWLNYERMDHAIPGAYKLIVGENDIYIAGDNEAGLFNGIQTFIQLLPLNEETVTLPQLNIEDYPRFAYRGMHLDVSRHFFPVEFIKRYIDYLALHKLNIFHWHLTDDQGWRIEIKKYPKLTSVGGWRNGTIIGRYPGTGNDGKKYGGYYTQEEIKEVVKYAQDRYIDVIPEIEMPGHASAAIAAYPELSCFPNEPTISYYPTQCVWSGSKAGKQVQQTWGVFDDVFCAGKDNTFSFLEDVLTEVLALFPSKYIHVGGDECPKTNWKKCPACQQRMKTAGLKNEHELQSYFIQRMEKFLNGKGRVLIGWDEILEGGLAPNAVVMSWRGEQGGIDAAKQNHDVIMTPGNPVYFDYSQTENEDSVTIGGFNPIEKVYAYEPVPKELNAEQATHILGAQANLWTEYIDNTKKLEYMLFPRMAALSEILWTGKGKKDWSDFEKRLSSQLHRYNLWKANYSKAYFDIRANVIPAEDNNGIRWQLTARNKEDKIVITRDIYDSRADTYTEPIKVGSLGKYYAAIQDKTGHIVGNWIEQQFAINKATGKKIKLVALPSEKYPGDGAFTLLNGIVNEKGFAKSKEFIGFSGTDCEAIIDLGSIQEISYVVVNTLHRPASWIWKPAKASLFGSGDGEHWYPLKETDIFEEKKNGTGKGTMTLAFRASPVQYVKLVLQNAGTIPEGNAGAGNKAWLFVDEIQILN